MSDDEEPAAEAAPAPPEPGVAESRSVRLTKAERLEAKAARLREAELRRAAEAEAAAAGRAGTPPRSGPPTGLVVAVSVLGALVLLLGVAVGIGLPWALHQRHLYHHQHDLLTRQLAKNAAVDALPAQAASALRAARQYAVDFGSYDYRHLDADLAKVASELTPTFAKSYEKSAAGLKPTIIKFHGKSVATVQAAAVASVTAKSATVLVFLDQTVTSSQTTQPRIDRNRIVMTLSRPGPKWLIANLQLK